MASLRARERAHPHSRQDLTPQGGNLAVRRHGQPRNHRTRSVRPINPQTRPATEASKHQRHGLVRESQKTNSPNSSADRCRTALGERSFGLSPSAGEMPTDGCNACGFRAEHLIQLTDMAWRWIPKDDSLFEALLRVALGSVTPRRAG